MFVTIRFIAKMLLTIMGVVSFASPAHASTSASFVYGRTNKTKSSPSNSLDVSFTEGLPHVAANVTLDGDSGLLKVYAKGHLYGERTYSGRTDYSATSIGAAGVIQDTVTFNIDDTADPAPLYARLYYSMSGKFSDNYIAPDGTFSNHAPSEVGYLYHSGYGRFSLTAYAQPDDKHATTMAFVNTPEYASSVCRIGVNTCVVGYDPEAQSGYLQLPLTSLQYTVVMSFSVQATGVTSDFSRTTKLFLSVPEGVKFTSESGTFLSKATPITGVPLPGAYFLMISGASLLLLRRRRPTGIN